jgi:membrane protein implicated in regulation of membrane protease activity
MQLFRLKMSLTSTRQETNMTDSTLWWLGAGVLIAAELVTGTFYLLMVAIGLIAAALAAHAGSPTTWQWACAGVVGGGSVLLWWRFKQLQAPSAPAGANHDATMDVGGNVNVQAWRDDGTCSVKYRGAQWECALLAGEVAGSGRYIIAEVVGSCLILKKTPTP